MAENNKPLPKGAIKRSLKYCLELILRYKKSYLFWSAANVLLCSAIPFSEIVFLPLLIDSMAQGKGLKTTLLYGAAMAASKVILGGLSSCVEIHLEKSADLFMNAAMEEVSVRCMEIDYSLTENAEALDQAQKARRGIGWSEGAHNITQKFFNIISSSMKIVGVTAVMLMNAPLMLAVILVILTAQAIVNKKKNDIEIAHFSELSNIDRIFRYLSHEMEDFRYGKDVRLYSAAGMMLKRTMHHITRIDEYYKKLNGKKYPLEVLNAAAGALQDLFTYTYLGILAILGRITIGTYSQLLSAGGTLYVAMFDIIFALQEIVKRSSYLYETISFMEYPPVMQKSDRHIENLNSGHEIEFRNVSFSYPGSDVKVLHDVSLKLKSGEKLSVVGLNGAGKTTFIKLLCRLYDVDSGEILLDGVNIREYDYDEYMKLFSVVFQDFRLLAFSAAENIFLGSEGGEEKLSALFKKVGIDEKIKSLPHGADTMMFKTFDKEGVELSGGEQQKLAIARALYKDSPVVILDEPTAALDPVAEYEIYRQFNDLVNGKTAVYISHRLSSCKFCEHIAVFSEGTVKEYGTHDELVHKRDGIYAEMFKAQAQYYV